MKLAGRKVIVDTNILVHVLRGKRVLAETYGLLDGPMRVVLPVVVKGELRAFALKCHWAQRKVDALESLVRRLPTADISSDAVIQAYAEIDDFSRTNGKSMGKNDVWIAAIARVVDGVVLTTDRDFDHLHEAKLDVEWVDPAGALLR